jgi:hypothetical protein
MILSDIHMSRREYIQSMADNVVAWFQSASESARGRSAHRRLRSIYRLLVELEDLSARYKPAFKNPALARKEPYKALSVRAHTLADRLNVLLSRYQLQPRIGEVRLGPSRWFLNWTIKKPKAAHTFFRPASELVPFEIPFTEANALLHLLELSQLGLLNRILPCEQCGRWLYAIGRKRFCNTDCQQRSFRSKPEFKKHRSKYMRGWRHLRNTGKVKSW